MDPKTTIEKLRVLLPHWIEHNRDHAAEFDKWAASARREGANSLAELLDKASAEMVATDAILGKALAEAGGTNRAHAHRHCHD